MKPSDFLTLLWTSTPPGLIHLWRLVDKRSFYFRAPGFTDLHAGRPDEFCGVSLAHADHGPRVRVHNDTAIAITGLWADIDTLGGPEDRTHGARDKGQAAELAHAVLEPTVIVDSGYGLQVYWLFDRVWRFTASADQERAALMSGQWHELLRREARRQGWHFDVSTRDLARLLRLPGTINGKGGQQAPVRVLVADGPRYDRDELAEMVGSVGNVSLEAVPGTPMYYDLGELRLGRGCSPPADKLQALLVNSPEFAATWARLRPEFADDQSRFDLSLATVAVQAQWDDREIAALIGAHRRWDSKSFRRDYLALTIGKARAEFQPTEV